MWITERVYAFMVQTGYIGLTPWLLLYNTQHIQRVMYGSLALSGLSKNELVCKIVEGFY